MIYNAYLTPFAGRHIPQTFLWVSTPELQRDFLIREVPTKKGNAEYWAKILHDSTQRAYAIYVLHNHVGNCGFKNLTDKEGELRIYVGDASMRKKGIGSSATRMLLDIAFNELGLKLVYVHVARANSIAKGMYETLGFKEVAELGGQWQGRGVVRMELRA